MFHLAWFLGTGFGIQPWNPPVDGVFTGHNATEWMKPELYIELTRSLERAGFDYLLIEDTQEVADTFRGNSEATLRLGMMAPKNDPFPLIPLLSYFTKHIGIMGTINTTFVPPYLAARMLTTLDHVTEGRVGSNLVTAIQDISGQNYGLDKLPPKDIRYEMANEWVDVVMQLQSSWKPGAVVMDMEKPILYDYTKVQPINFKGKYFNSRGPLSTLPGPQGITPIAQAGNSPGGRDLTARVADTILAVCFTVEEMKEFRADMHARIVGHGRKPENVKIVYMLAPVIGATDDDARRKHEAEIAMRWHPQTIETRLWYLDRICAGAELGSYDIETPVSEILDKIRAHSRLAVVEQMFKGQENKTLREVAATRYQANDLGMIGSPETIASKMDEMMQEVGGDGFLIWLPTTRRTIAEVCDGLAPVLQRRGLIRDGFEKKTFRENLHAF